MVAGVMDEQEQRKDRADKRFPSEVHRRQRGKNIALALVIAALMALFYVVAIVRMGGG